MKLLINPFFILSILSLNAQIEQTEAPAESTTFECNQIVMGEVRDKNTTDLLQEAIVVLSDKDGNVLETQRVQDNATFSFKIKCETTYKLEGRKVDFTAESKNFTTTDEADKELKLLISLGKGNIDFIAGTKVEKEEDIKEVEGVVEIQEEVEVKLKEIPEESPKKIKKIVTSRYEVKINPIYFDLASSYLSKKAKVQLRKTVALMKKYPKMIIELGAHSDAQGSDKINNWFSDRRAKRTTDYMIGKGIASNRITGKGHGATQLVNDCIRDAECTEVQHAKNRRTDFVIINM